MTNLKYKIFGKVDDYLWHTIKEKVIYQTRYTCGDTIGIRVHFQVRNTHIYEELAVKSN